MHEGPIDLQRIDRKASEMAQARITGAEVVEGEREAQLLEVAQYACGVGGLLHQKGFSQLELQKTPLQSSIGESHAHSIEKGRRPQLHGRDVDRNDYRKEPDLLPGPGLMTGFRQHPPADWDNEPAFFGDRYEFCRGHHPQFWMRPPDERLNPDDLTGTQIDLG